VDDDAEQLREDILAYGRRKNDPATVDVYIRHQLDTYTWLTQHGVEFGLIDTGTSEVSRVHTTPPGWLTGFLHEKFVARGGTEYLGSFHGAADLSGAALGKAAVFGRAAGLESSAGEGSYTR
jgi:succinate dehydrogenase/fumarate reductase flavoprotein subunit